MTSIASIRACLALVSPLVLGLVVTPACGGKDPYSPGEPVGTFHVTAKLARTTCGATPNPWEFDVRLNHEGDLLYWIQGGAPIQGRVDAAAKTQLRAESVYALREANAAKKLAICSVSRTDVLSVALAGADTKPAPDPATTSTFTGGMTYTFTPTAGSDCNDQLAAAGGGFEALPCQIDYELVGTFVTAAKR